MITVFHYLVLSVVLFAIGALGMLTRKNIIAILLSAEIMLNAVNLSFVAFSKWHDDISGQVIVLFIIAVAASEIAVGLAIAVLFFKKEGILDPNEMRLMKW